MKILITGGAGYIGTELIFKLSDLDTVSEIVVYDNLSRGNYNFFLGSQKLNKKVRFVQGDLLDSRKLKKVLSGVHTVYHLAAKVSTPFSDQSPHEFEQTNNWGTAELVYAIEESDVQRLIYASSVSVYGSSSDEITIETPLNPRTFYGISKMRGEEHVERLFTKVKTYIVRCGNVYGYSRSMRFDAVINRFMFDANYKQLITVNGNGEQTRAFIHIEKVTNAFVRLLNSEKEASKFNLVDRNLSVVEIAETLQNIYPDLETLFTNQHMKMRKLLVKPDLEINSLFKCEDCTLEKELLDFKQQFSF